MTRYNCRLQNAILSLSLYLLLLPGYSNAFFKVHSTGINHPRAINRIQFLKVLQVLKVTSPFPRLIGGDPRKRNAINYSGKLPRGCPIPLTISALDRTGNAVRFSGILTIVNYFEPSILRDAAGIRGDKTNLDELIAQLSKKLELKIVSRQDASSAQPDKNDEEVAIVMMNSNYKTNSNVLPKWDLEDMIEDAIRTTPQFQNLAPVIGNCGPSCPEICDAALKPDEDSIGVVFTTKVKSPNDIVNSFFPTKWQSTCIKQVQGVCTTSPKNTCHNGGSCATNRDTSPNICTCRPQTNLYGSRCQLLTRSYEGTSANNYSTHHRLSHSGNIAIPQPQKLTFSFEHAGKCQLDSGLCTIVSVKASDMELLRVEEGVTPNRFFNTATLPTEESSVEKNMTLLSDAMVQNNQWLDVTVHVEVQGNFLKATTVFCTKDASPVCVEKTVEKTGALYRLKNVELTLGGHVSGCFRNVRFNGGLVDLKLGGSTAGTYEGCRMQNTACSNKCGDGDANSNCYGMLGSAVSAPCSCQCASTKRMPAERITQPMQCSAQCTTESPIISVSGSGTLNWKGTNSASIPLNPQAPLTISFLLRTKQAVTSELLKVEGSSITISIKLEDKHLLACIAGNCYAFSSVIVNDGKWHEIFAMVAKTQLTVRVSDYTRVYIIPSYQPVSGATVSMQLTNSCTRNVRLSGIYMPASDADKTVEKDSSNSIKLHRTGTVSANTICTVKFK